MALLVQTGAHAGPEVKPLPRQPLWAKASPDDMIWTSAPVHIDRSKQTYERIALPSDPFPFKPRAVAGMAVQDSRSFSMGGEFYLLDAKEGWAPKALCVDEQQRRFACGQRSRAVLRTAISRGLLECRRKPIAQDAYLISCGIKERYRLDPLSGPVTRVLTGQLPQGVRRIDPQ